MISASGVGYASDIRTYHIYQNFPEALEDKIKGLNALSIALIVYVKCEESRLALSL